MLGASGFLFVWCAVFLAAATETWETVVTSVSLTANVGLFAYWLRQ